MDTREREKSFDKAKTVVYRLLDIRLRSEHEIREKLAVKSIPDPIVEQTVRYFKDLDLIDDRQFARQWVSSRLKKPFGLNRIRLELRKKRIPGDIIDDVLSAAAKEYDELGTVIELAQHRAEKYKDIDPVKARQRLYGYLQRRGFNSDAILKAIKSL